MEVKKIWIFLFFFIQIFSIPFIINLFSVNMYGTISPEFSVVLLVVHVLRGIGPTVYVLLWFFFNNAFQILYRPLAFTYYVSLIISCFVATRYGNVPFAIGTTFFQLIWVVTVIPFIRHYIQNFVNETDENEPSINSINMRVLNVKFNSKDFLIDDNCAICLEYLNEKPLMTTSCNHTFHSKCLLKWTSVQQDLPTCPLCNHSLRSGVCNIAIA
eukprot:NODE_184_length_15718_cov_0.161342.p9 type:complete len:214 gc:universal NODE_184_length_15718_cov_0.161342:4300-4941(+)